MAIVLSFSPRASRSSTHIQDYVEFLGSKRFLELASFIVQRMEKLSLTPEELCKEFISKSKKGKETENTMLEKFRLMTKDGIVPRYLEKFIFERLQISESELEALEKIRKRRVQLAEAYCKSELFLFKKTLWLILRHADFILKYKELSEIKCDFFVISLCWFGGRFYTLGELLHNYKQGRAILPKSCPRCGGDMYGYHFAGSVLSGAKSYGCFCPKCEMENSEPVPGIWLENNGKLKPLEKCILFKDKSYIEFANPDYVASKQSILDFPPKKMYSENVPWNLLTLVCVLSYMEIYET